MVIFRCPRDGDPCRAGCPAAEQTQDWVREQQTARRLNGRGGDVTQRDVDQEMGKRVYKRRPVGSKGKGIGDLCGRSGQLPRKQ